MRVLFYALIIIIGILSGTLVVRHYYAFSKQSDAVIAPTLTPTPIREQLPIAVIIPKIDINAAIERVGVDGDGRMDVPKDAFNVGWYEYGVKPGEVGNAVFAGHLDTVTGAPAIFYNLSRVEVGDEIVVTTEEGKQLTFSVIRKETYDSAQFPLEDVFGASDKKMLNLITCQGWFDYSAQEYSHRLVLYTELRDVVELKK